METVKTAFGFITLALPVFLLERIIGDGGVHVFGDARRGLLQLGVYRESGAKKPWMRLLQILVGGRAGERPSAIGLGVWHLAGQTQAPSEFYTD